MNVQGRGLGRWVLVALLGCLALLASTPTFAEAATVTGKVTNAKGEGIAGVEVRYYSSADEYGRFVTESNGEYGKDINATAGVFKVEFVPLAGSKYTSQYYEDKLSYATATPVTVEENKPSPPVSAVLEVGASISGTVTSATPPHSGIEHVEVTAYEKAAPNAAIAHAETDQFGIYGLMGLAKGSYVIGFKSSYESGLDDAPQFYPEKGFFLEAKALSVGEGAEELNIDAKLVQGASISGTVTDAATGQPLVGITVIAIPPGGAEMLEARTFTDINEPANKVAPVASGAPAVGQTLSCSNGSWTGIGTLTYAYKWLRNGAPIAGASASTYTVQAADQGTGLACVVTATNEIETEVIRSVSANSNTVTVPMLLLVGSPPPASRPKVILSISKLVASRGVARVPIACVGARCSGTIELTEQEVTKTHRGKKTIVKKKTIVLGSATYSLAVGHSATISIHLIARGKSVLAKAKHHQLTAEIIASVVGGAATNRSVMLSETVATKRR